MDEVRLLKHSKSYLDALVQGRDPIQGGQVPADSVLGQERLIKCFQYISGVLQREIDRLSVPAPAEMPALAPRVEKPQSPQEQEAAHTLNIRDAAGAVRKALNLPVHQNRGWVEKAVREWMCLKNLLVPYDRDDGKTGYLPTQEGESVGLITVVSEKSGYSFAAFSEKSLNYAVEHAEEIRNLEMSKWDPLLACLTPEWLRSARVLQETAPASACLKAILAQLPPDLPRVPKVQEVNLWLVKQGILEERFQNTRRILVPAESGENLGFVPDKRQFGISWSVKGWTPAAQQFVLDNLPGLVQDLRSGEAWRLVPADFAVTEEMRSQLLGSRQSQVYWRRLEDWLNAVLAPETGFRLPEGLVRKFLIEGGWLEVVSQPDGRKIKQPTQAGLAIGLAMPDGQYPAEIYTPQAQAWVLDHLEEIVDSYCG